MVVAIAHLCASWPEAVQREIKALKLVTATVICRYPNGQGLPREDRDAVENSPFLAATGSIGPKHEGETILALPLNAIAPCSWRRARLDLDRAEKAEPHRPAPFRRFQPRRFGAQRFSGAPDSHQLIAAVPPRPSRRRFPPRLPQLRRVRSRRRQRCLS